MKSKEKESVQWEAPRIRNHGEHPDNRGHVKRGTMASKTNFLPLIEDPPLPTLLVTPRKRENSSIPGEPPQQDKVFNGRKPDPRCPAARRSSLITIYRKYSEKMRKNASLLIEEPWISKGSQDCKSLFVWLEQRTRNPSVVRIHCLNE